MTNPNKCAIDPADLSGLAVKLQGLRDVCWTLAQVDSGSGVDHTPEMFFFLADATQGLVNDLKALDPEKIRPDKYLGAA